MAPEQSSATKRFLSATPRYTLIGAAFGFCFPVFSTCFEMLLSGLPLTLASAIEVQASEPLLWVIDTAPLFLGLLAALAGARQDQLSRLKAELEDKVADQTAALRLKTTDLEQEVAQRREADSDLIQAYTELDQILNTSANGIRVIDKDFNVIKANQAFINMAAISREELLGKKCYSVFPGPYCHSPNCALTKVMNNQPFLEAVTPRKRGDQRTIMTHVTASPFVDREGNLKGIVEDSRDITEHIEDQMALAQSENKYRRLFEQSGDAILIHDQGGQILDVNKSACDMLGYPREQLLAVSMRSLHPGEIQGTTGDALESMETEGTVNLEGQFQRADGTVIEVEVAARLIDQEEGLVQQNVRDITDRKQALEALRTALEELEEANSLKSRFLYNVSHEIRTPLNGIFGFAEAITVSHNLTDTHHHARTILQESESLLSLLNELLDLGKIEAGHLELDYQPMDLPRLLESVMNYAVPQAKAKGLQCDISMLEETPRFIVADPVRVRQVLVTLFSNAIKYTAEGSVCLRVELVQFQEKQAILLFSVTDTGVGIPEGQQTKIFRSFAQGDVSTARRYGGIGLGTTIIQHLVTMMNGEVGLQSEPEKGSTFWFTLPAEIADPTEISREGEDSHSQREPDGQRQAPKGTILLVDDHVTNQEVMKLHLEVEGYKVKIATNGEAAVTACAQHDFDLILMDLQMPVMDGFEATRQIRSLMVTVPILALTASAEAGTKESCEKSGMNDIIMKPVRKSSLLAVIGHWLSSSREDDTPEASGPGPIEDKEEGPALGDSPPMDYELAVQEFGGNKPLVNNVAAQFIDKAEKQIQLLQEAVDMLDVETIRADAHSIKGAAATLTAEPLSTAAARLETMAKSGVVGDAEVLWNELHREFQRLAQFLSS